MLGNEALANSLGPIPRLFVIVVLEVDVPHVEIGTKDIAHGVNRRQHRMILIVVAVLAVAAYQLQIRYVSQVVSNAAKVFFEVFVVDRIGLRHSNNDAVENILRADKAELHAFASGQVYEGLIVGVPQLIPACTKYSRPETCGMDPAPWRDFQFLKFWIRPTLTSGEWM